MQRKKSLYVFAYFFLNAILMLMAFIFEDYLSLIEWISFIQLILSVYFVSKVSGEILSVYNVFIILTYLFHFGQALIRIFPFEDIHYDRSVIAKSSPQLLIQAELFAMLCIFAISMGYLLTKENKNPNKDLRPHYEADELQRLKSLSLTIFFVTLLPMIYIDVQKIFALSSIDYDATYLVYQTGVGKYIGLIAQFGKPSLSLLIYAYHKNKKASTFIMAMTTIYLVFMMFSGDRGSNLIYIITNLFIFFIFVRRPKFKTVLLGAVVGYVLLGILSSISIFRYTEFSISAFLEAYTKRSGDGIFYSALREFGGTMLSLTHAFEYIPHYSNYGCGVTYLASGLYISPVLPTIVVDFFEKSVSYIHAFPESAIDYISLGGSYLGELYYNFGWLAPFAALLIGRLLKKIDRTLMIRSNPRVVAVIIVLLPSLILWVRDFYVDMIFKTFWLAILILFVKWGRHEKSINNYNG